MHPCLEYSIAKLFDVVGTRELSPVMGKCVDMIKGRDVTGKTGAMEVIVSSSMCVCVCVCE